MRVYHVYSCDGLVGHLAGVARCPTYLIPNNNILLLFGIKL